MLSQIMLQQLADRLAWREKMSKIADNLGIPYELLYLSFEAVHRYLDAPIKDKKFWKNWLFLGYCNQKIDRFGDPEVYKAGGPEMAQMSTIMQLPLNLSQIEEEERRLLKKLIKSGKIKNYHRAATTTAKLEIVIFSEKAGKHPFDYVLEDLKEDISTFNIMLLETQADATN